MALPTPQSAATKWSQNLGQAASDGRIQSGIAATTVSPGQAAARQKQAWVQNVAASADKWARNVSSVTLQAWQQDAINKGLPRIASGATAAEPKFTQFMTQLLGYQATALQSLPSRGNFQANVARMNAWVTAMHNFTYNKAQA